MNIKKITLSLLVLLTALLLPFQAYASGWTFNLGANSHWGSSSCTKSGPTISFNINGGASNATIAIQYLSGGRWYYEASKSWSGGDTSISSTSYGSQTTYRLYVSTASGGYAVGDVTCVP
ncbi:hypothetical protein ACFO25_03565 [Paenactinomyces guangxiensis]|nr:hypothetical protein [Paenactinomyces guangxiensis]